MASVWGSTTLSQWVFPIGGWLKASEIPFAMGISNWRLKDFESLQHSCKVKGFWNSSYGSLELKRRVLEILDIESLKDLWIMALPKKRQKIVPLIPCQVNRNWIYNNNWERERKPKRLKNVVTCAQILMDQVHTFLHVSMDENFLLYEGMIAI